MKKLAPEDIERGWISCSCGREAAVYLPGLIAVRAVALCPECGIVAVEEDENRETGGEDYGEKGSTQKGRIRQGKAG